MSSREKLEAALAQRYVDDVIAGVAAGLWRELTEHPIMFGSLLFATGAIAVMANELLERRGGRAVCAAIAAAAGVGVLLAACGAAR